MLFDLLFSPSVSFKDILIVSLLSLPIVLISLSLHEASHALVAYKLGDPTARNFGRVTLNPIKHIDIFGFITMFLVGFGWANPVPINARNFKKPRNGMAISALAGPVSNLLLSFVFAGLMSIYIHFIFPNIVTVSNYMALYYIELFFLLGVRMNIALAVFNMIPVPPLDGSRILYIFLPPKYYFKVMKYERYIGIGILLAFVITSYFNIDLLGFVINPIMDGIFWLVGLG